MLPALLAAVAAHPRSDAFEVCVSDNASTDDTAEVITAACAAQPTVAVRRARQATNLGFAGNFEAVARQARGDWFVVLADDDTLRPGALDLLREAAAVDGERFPLVIVNSLPGADAVRRGLKLPAQSIPLADASELLDRLGIFHASFISNLVFHRRSAIESWPGHAGRSRYPHMIVALALLRLRPAWYNPGGLVDVELPADTGEQPLLSCIDMARVLTDEVFTDPRLRVRAWGAYRYLMQMIPTAVYLARTGGFAGDPRNPHAALTLANVSSCYAASGRARSAAQALYLIARSLPRPILRGILRLLSRHAR